jgi:uncharacterized membrane protein YkvA (DUF1232 family)
MITAAKIKSKNRHELMDEPGGWKAKISRNLPDSGDQHVTHRKKVIAKLTPDTAIPRIQTNQPRLRRMRMSENRKTKQKMRELLLFIPNLMGLLIGLLRDERVSQADKAILAGIIMYVIVPIDIIPDFIPFIGQVDDSYLLAISILRLLNRADRRVIMDHWKGQRDIKELVASIARIAEFFLPKPVKNVLRGRIEPKGRLSVIADAPAGSNS